MNRSARTLRRVLRNADHHWVGDGFPVRTLFSYADPGAELSPFLLLDYAGPMSFPPTDRRLGVGEHPHRGFETVTIVYSGEVEHRDSAGGGGCIGPGDVQWMTAGAGLVHEEFHGRNFARHGGLLEMTQLWVNLPAKYKMTPPAYQGITKDHIPVVDLAGGRGHLRVIAGEYDGIAGPARTFTPVHVWDLRLSGEQGYELVVPDGYTAALVVLNGVVQVHGAESPVTAAEVALFERSGNCIAIDSAADTMALLLCGEPIVEPVVGSGPFVMNTPEEIRQAIDDYRAGRLGNLS